MSSAAAPDRERRIRRVLVLTFVLNLAVAASKIAYGIAAHALAVRADGFHSLTDATNNLVGVVALWFASRPADEEHPYGHHKIEILASVLVGLSLLAMAVDVVRSAAGRLAGTGAVPEASAGMFVLLAATLVVNVAVARYEKNRGDRLESPFLVSDAAHTRSDALVTVSVIGAMALVEAGYPISDLLAAVGVAAFIARAGVGVLRTNLGYLTDTALIDVPAIESIVARVPGVAGAHKIRTRGFPGSVHVDLHLQIAPHLNVVDAHRITHLAADAIRDGIVGVADVVIHTEPAGPDQPYNPVPDDW